MILSWTIHLNKAWCCRTFKALQWHTRHQWLIWTWHQWLIPSISDSCNRAQPHRASNSAVSRQALSYGVTLFRNPEATVCRNTCWKPPTCGCVPTCWVIADFKKTISTLLGKWRHGDRWSIMRWICLPVRSTWDTQASYDLQ